MTPGEQKQQLILSLTQGGGIFCGLFGLPHAQAELKPLSSGLLRQTRSQTEFTDGGTDNNGAIYRLISQKILPSEMRAAHERQNEKLRRE
ncbi:response regulator transcription factor [Pantoea sp. S62]|nr:response regulator transcription factor [Pantoea sp. S62]